jgi:hypothetical protein
MTSLWHGPKTVLLIGCALLAAGPASAEQPAKARGLVIKPNPEAKWDAPIENVRAVLNSAAEQLWQHFPGHTLDPILVDPQGGPVAIFQRGPHGEYQVKLGTGGLFWSQYAYQFAHEFCHILCKYDATPHRNKWFEESLCETASLFTLRRMSKAWAAHPPYPNWKDYAKPLAAYADERIRTARLPADKTLAAWFREEAPHLCANAALRDKNTTVAVALLPLFEGDPRRWEAVSYINVRKPPKDETFSEFLDRWQASSPRQHQAFIRKIADRFGIRDQMRKP